MPRFSAHLGYLFSELPMAERFAAARAAGFGAVEHPDPYTTGIGRFAKLAAESGLDVAQIAAPAGDAACGEKGLACLPGRQGEFRTSVDEGISAARSVGAPLLHVMSGLLPADTTRAELRDGYIAGIDWAAERAAAAGLTLIVEAISDQTVPGFYLNDPAFAAALLIELGRDDVKLLFDSYHAAANGIEPARFLARHLDLVGHVHVADHPGRNEPGTGTLNFGELFRLLDDAGYPGWVGCEYKPHHSTADGLGWLAEFAK